MRDESADVIITVQFRIDNCVNRADVDETEGSGITLHDIVEYLIDEEGIFGITEDSGKLVMVDWAQPPYKNGNMS